MKVRLYSSDDYAILSPWFSALSTFYDGHTEDNKLIDQLVDKHEKDPYGFFTTAKEIYVCENEEAQIAGFFCLNYKRGNSVKVGPIIVAPETRGRGVGKYMFTVIEQICIEKRVRKIYATTSHLNHAVNSLFKANWYTPEAQYPDQYKVGSSEIVWGKILIHDSGLVQPEISSMLGSQPGAYVREFNPDTDKVFLERVVGQLGTLHDDLGSDFIEATIAGYMRGKEFLGFQSKTKDIRIAFTDHSESVFAGLGIFSPKRGGPGKLYPFVGTKEGQKALVQEFINTSKNVSVRKLYTFCSAFDVNECALLEQLGFTNRGTLIQPYKPNTRLATFDFFIS